MQQRIRFSPKPLMVPATVMTAFWILAGLLWHTTGSLIPIVLFGYIGTSIGLGLGLYALLPKRQKPLGRRLALVLIGTFLFGGAAVLGGENMQLEGVFFSLLTGVVQAAVIHYLIAKIFGPLLFGRLWCGWACWTAMILDLLPYTRSTGRMAARWSWVRYTHFGVSLGLVGLLWFGFGYGQGAIGQIAVYWFVVGNALYYLLGITLAIMCKDNRAFCKYVCPVTVPLKLTSRFALLKIGGDSAKCTECQACVTMCPMNIRIPEYIKHGERVLSTECILCQTCISMCAHDALKLSFDVDIGGKDVLAEKQTYAHTTVLERQ